MDDFREIEERRNSENLDVLDRLHYIFTDFLNRVGKEWTEFCIMFGIDGKVPYEVLTQRLSRQERLYFQSELENLISEMMPALPEGELKKPKSTSSQTPLSALNKILTIIVQKLYSDVSVAIIDLILDQYSTTYENSKALVYELTGVGKTEKDFLHTDEILNILNKNTWRANGKTLDDVLKEEMSYMLVDVRKVFKLASIQLQDVSTVFERLDATVKPKENRAKTILRTDSDYFGSLSQERAYTELGFDSVIFVAVIDERTSDICLGMDGSVIPIEDLVPGETIPPLHNNCRSSLAPNFEDGLPLYLDDEEELYFIE